MGESTGISWTDHTFNPWWGCLRVSPGCVNCYAETFAKRTGHDVWGPQAEYRTFGWKYWQQPVKWNAEAKMSGIMQKMFVASMADLFDSRGPESERIRYWSLLHVTPHLIHQTLTKRPENWRAYLPNMDILPTHLWLGFSAENQEYFDLRAKHIAEVRNFAGPFFVSYEPALGPLRIKQCDSRLKWLIFGGESGPNRRPMEVGWAEDIKADCERLGIAFFMKQMGARTPEIGKQLIPAHLLIQEFPDSASTKLSEPETPLRDDQD